MVVVGRPQSVQTTSVIGVLDPRSLDFFDHLIDDATRSVSALSPMAAFGQCGRSPRRARSSPRSIALQSSANARRSGESSGHGAVPEFIKILEAGSRSGEVAPVDHGLGVGDGSSEVGKIHRRPESRVGRESAGTLAATKGAADRLRSSVNKAIDLRIDIVILLADATRTGGWSASPDGGCTRIARLRGAARQEVH